MSKTFSSSYANVTISDPTYNPVSITTSGTITGTATALYSDLAALTVTNSGKVAGGTGGGKAGVSLHSGGGLISNQSGGTITGTYGIVLTAGGTVVNAGGVAGSGAAVAKGVQFGASGEVTNQSGGVITGNYDGVFASSGSLTVVNAGSIADVLNAALDLRGGGVVTNSSSGRITGGVQGVAVSGDVGTITNQGIIIGQGALGAGVALAAGGFVSNTSLGTISAGRFGVLADGAATVMNDGSLNGGSYDGIALRAGGTASNSATGRITGGANGIYVQNATGTVINAGTVTGTVAVNLLAGGEVSNASAAVIRGGIIGVQIVAGTLDNAGKISTTGAAQDAVLLVSSGVVTNRLSGIITGSLDGIYATSGTGTVTNSGAVTGGLGKGIALVAGGAVINQQTGSVSGAASGVYIANGVGQVTNNGIITGISGGSAGVNFAAGGLVTNLSKGTISGIADGVQINGSAGTVFNAGTIEAPGAFAVRLAAGHANRVAMAPGAVFDGTVDGGNIIGSGTVSTLELASAATQGTLSGLGSQFVDFAAVTIDANANWTISSAIQSGQALTNDGTLTGVVLLAGGASVTNTSSGTITGTADAIYAPTSAVSVTIANAGSIAVSGTSGTALNLDVAASISNTGRIVGANVAVDVQGVATVLNKGSIGASASGGSGVNLQGGGVLSNASTGTITGLGFGAYLGNAGTLINDGSLQGFGITGIAFSTGGTVTNHKGGTIIGHYSAVGINGGFGVITNDGAILAPTGTGLALSMGATVTNLQDGTISALDYGIELENAVGTVANEGSLNGNQNDGAALFLGGSLSNASTGTITGYGGVAISGGAGTVINAGSIGATGNFALRLAAGYSNLLIVDPGATFNSHVDGGNTIGAAQISTLELASGASTGVLSGLGVQFIDFAQITVDANASWTLNDSNTIGSGVTLTELSGASVTIAGALENDGAIVLDPSTLTVGSLAGTGSVTIEAGSTLDIQATVSTGATIGFAGSGAYLHFETPADVAGKVTNFDLGETIDLKGVDAATVSFQGGKLSFNGGSFSLALANPHPVSASASGDGAAVTLLCFCVDTLILTPSGERCVQHLAIGDAVVTVTGAVRRIVWIGTGSVLATRGRRGAATPVIVHKGALGDNVPDRDLRLTKGHSLYLAGALIPVEYLVNHRTIEWDDRAQEVKLYHIELGTHDVLIANGAPAESYRDDGNRWLFRNANSGWGATPKEPYAPVLTGGPVVDKVWRHLMDRAGALPELPLTTNPDLHLVVDGRRVDAVSQHGEAHIFALATRPREVRIVSRSAAPDELGVARDPRVLGVALRQIVLRRGTRFHTIKAADARLAEGFHAFEATNGWRWTSGNAVVPATWSEWPTGPMELVLHVGCTSRYAVGAGARSAA